MTRFLTLIIILLAILSNNTYAANIIKKKQIIAKEQESPKNAYQKIFSGKKYFSSKGIITIHNVEGEIFLEIPSSLIGKQLIFGTTITNTSNSKESTIGLHPKPNKTLVFLKTDSLIQIGSINNNYICSDIKDDPTETKNILEAINNSKQAAIIASFPIICKSNNDSCSVINASDFFKGDKEYLLPKDEYAYNNMKGFVIRTYKYNDKIALIDTIESKPNSFSVTSELSYYVTRKLFTLTTIAENESLTAKVKSTFFLLEPSNFKPQITDSRFACQTTKVLDYSPNNQGAKVTYLATKWNTTNKDKPIISFYLDPNFPLLWQKAIQNAADIWNDGFKQIGYTKAIELLKPNDSTDINDINISTIRYIYSPQEGISSSIWIKPQSGEIFNAYIGINYNVIKEYQRDALISLGAQYPNARSMYIDTLLFSKMLTQKVAHHIGKCLGLSENLKGSIGINSDSLKSASYTKKHGISNSIMDVFSFNYIANEQDIKNGASICQQMLGLYDISTIKYLYSNNCLLPDEFANYKYGKKVPITESYDPYSQEADLGDNAIKTSSYALENLYTVIANANKWLQAQDTDLSYRGELYDYLVERYFTYCSNVLKYIGGIEQISNAYSSSPSYKPIDKKTQAAALHWILEQIEQSKKMESNQLMDNSELNTGIADYLSLELFNQALKRALSIELSEQISLHSYSRQNALEQIFNYIWEDNKTDLTLSSNKKKMQISFINEISKALGLDSKEVTLDLDRAQIFEFLIKSSKNAKNRNAKSSKDKDHYKYLIALINQKLRYD